MRWIRQKKDVTAGTNMQSFKAYVLARDAARTPVVEPAHSLPRPGKCYIHTQLSAIFMCLCMYVYYVLMYVCVCVYICMFFYVRAGASASFDPAGPSDADLVAAAMEVDSPRECTFIIKTKLYNV